MAGDPARCQPPRRALRARACTFRLSQIPIAQCAALSAHHLCGFVPWRLSDAGRQWMSNASCCRHPKPCTTTDLRGRSERWIGGIERVDGKASTRAATRTTVPLRLRTDGEVKMEEWFRIGANIASILTSIIAAGASVVYWANKRSGRARLESYLKAKKEKSPNEPFSVTRLMADLGMTEAEIFAASFASRHIARGVRRDRATGFAAEVVFQYREDPQGAQERTSGNPDLVVSQDGPRDLDERAQFGRK
jgi:hypothetical protein